MTFALNDVADWYPELSCTLTALCSVSGRSVPELAHRITSLARLKGVELGDAPRPDYHPSDWRPVIEDLGGSYFIADNFSEALFPDRPSITEWFGMQLFGSQVELVICDDNCGIGHVFATFEQEIVDTFTGGRRIKFVGVPPEFEELRVRYTLVIE